MIGMSLILTTMLLSWFVTFFYTTDPNEVKVGFLNPDKNDVYLSHYLYEVSRYVNVALYSLVIYLFSPDYKWIKSVLLAFFVIKAIMIFNYIITGSQIEIELFIILFLGVCLINLLWKR